jgi:arginyl-tRNA synthetase
VHLQQFIDKKVQEAMTSAQLPDTLDPQVRPATQPQFGDYQVNGLLAAAKPLGCAPRKLAEQVMAHLDLQTIAQRIEIAGPGFINIFLSPDWLAQQAECAWQDPQLAVTLAVPQTIVVDYSGPNVAKEMAVHHIRSTVIGDAMVRTLIRLGHRVIRANHIGDWGTQFGMLLAHLTESQRPITSLTLQDLERGYREAKQRYDSDPAFAERSRLAVVQLQQGDPHHLAQWRQMVEISMQQNQKLYERLKILLTPDDVMGESLYNPHLPHLIADLKAQGLAVSSEGAWVVYLPQFTNKNGEPMGVIVQKSDGGFLYTTTDIACAKYRYDTYAADRLLYYVDSRQQQHLQQAWAIVRQAGYLPPQTTLEHHAFGMMLGADGKPFKTRSGETIKLADLLDEALERADRLITTKSPDLTPEQHQKAVEVIAMGSLKYADLAKHRATDYCFDWERLLSFEGNTAPYLLYAYSRIISLFKRAQCAPDQLSGTLRLSEPAEQRLAIQLLRFEETLYQVAAEGLPHLMCHYLYELAGLFSSFYERCPILKASHLEERQSRLKLAALTAKTLQQGLATLGIETLVRM